MHAATAVSPHAPEPSSTPAPDKAYWTAHYHTYLRERLAWARDYIRQQPPSEIAAHFPSFITLLRQARRFPDLHLLCAEVIAALHPHPQYWGHWAAWETELRFAAAVFAQHQQPRRQAEFSGYLVDLLQQTGRYVEARALGEAALDLARTTCALIPQAQITSSLATVLRSQGQTSAAAALIQTAKADIMEAPCVTPREQALAGAALSLAETTVFRTQGDLPQAIALVNQALDALLPFETEESHWLALIHNHRGLLRWAAGEYTGAAADMERALDLFRAVGDLYAEAESYGILGLIYWSLSDYARAEDAIRRDIAFNDRLGAWWHQVRDVGNLALVYLGRRELDTALVHLAHQETLSLQLGDESELARCRANRGAVYLCQGDYAAGAQELETAMSYYHAHHVRTEDILSDILNQARCYAYLGDPERARQMAQDALDSATCANADVLRGLALRCLADYTPSPEREQYLYESLDIARRHRRRLDEADCLLALAHTAATPVEQTRLWEQGAAILHEIGAALWLEGAAPEQPPRMPSTGV